MTKIKICGITELEDAKLAVGLGVDALGFNFYEKSRRFIDLERAREIVCRMPLSVWRVGVFVNARLSAVEEVAAFVGLDTVQLLNDEAADRQGGSSKLRIIRVVRVSEGKGVERAVEMSHLTDTLLLDRFVEGQFGGTGEAIDEQTLDELKTRGVMDRVLLAGGLTPDNVGERVRKYRPYGVDVAGGVESEPGKKDPSLLRAFVEAVRKTSV